MDISRYKWALLRPYGLTLPEDTPRVVWKDVVYTLNRILYQPREVCFA